MFNSKWKRVLMVVTILNYSTMAFAQLPTVCDAKYKATVLPYIEELEKIGPPEFIKKIKKSKPSKLIDFHYSFKFTIQEKWYEGKDAKVDLMKMQNRAGIKHIEDMSLDLIEGIWAKNSKSRCQTLKKEHEQLEKDLKRVEILPDEKPKK